jgi:hypothetical protein
MKFTGIYVVDGRTKAAAKQPLIALCDDVQKAIRDNEVRFGIVMPDGTVHTEYNGYHFFVYVKGMDGTQTVRLGFEINP